MFCPNCGTQNPDAAETCSKCAFHLRGAAAPKFKGTMLMMNQRGAAPPPPAAAPPPPPRPPGASPMPSKLKGTMVGVAPPPPAQHPGQMPPPQGPPPAVPLAGAGRSSDPAAFAPTAIQPAVNPLSGTVVAAQSAFAPPPAGQGVAAPGGSPYGAPPTNAPEYSVPPHGPVPYGQNAPAFPQPPGAQAPGGPMRHTPMQGMMAYGQQPPGAGGRLAPMPSVPPPGLPRPTKRDARMTFALPGAAMLIGFVLYVVLVALGSSLAVLPLLLLLGGAIGSAVLAVQMASELKSVTRNEAFVAWPIFVPVYNLYWAWVVVPAEVARAKQMTGVRTPVRPLVQYVLLWHFALASDINDLVRPGSSPSSSGLQ